MTTTEIMVVRFKNIAVNSSMFEMRSRKSGFSRRVVNSVLNVFHSCFHPIHFSYVSNIIIHACCFHNNTHHAICPFDELHVWWVNGPYREQGLVLTGSPLLSLVLMHGHLLWTGRHAHTHRKHTLSGSGQVSS